MNRIDQGSRAVRDANDSDVTELMRMAKSSASFGDSWMCEALPSIPAGSGSAHLGLEAGSSGPASSAAGEDSSTKKSAQEEVIFMAPAAVKMNKDLLPTISAEMLRTIEMCQKALHDVVGQENQKERLPG